MENDVLDIMIGVEDELASLYTKIKNVSRLESVKEVLDYLIEETVFHSKRIEGLKTKFDKPVLQTEMIQVLYGRIKDSLYNTLSKTYDYNSSIDIMANTEDSIGKIYKTISNHFSRLSDYYQKVSDEINQLSTEEAEHKSILLQKKTGIAG